MRFFEADLFQPYPRNSLHMANGARHWKSALIGLMFTTTVISGCRRDPVWPPDVASGAPTPYLLQLPAWVYDSLFPPFLPGNNPMTVEGVALGRLLFHEKALSDDLSMSCASCHLQQHAFSDPLTFSIGTDGSLGTRNAMAIVNLAWDEHFFWDGRSHSLEQQAFLPVTDPAEMRNSWPVVEQRLREHPTYPELFSKAFGSPDIDSLRIVQAIAQFERTLLSFNSRFDQFYYGGDSLAMTEPEQRGMEVFFRSGHCIDCHRPPLFADHGLRNNGLDLVPTDPGLGGITGQAWDVGAFKVPTLRNIAQSAPYMHDGRFNTLEEVVHFYAEDVEVNTPYLDNHMFPWVEGLVNLSLQDREDLVAFMNALTDMPFLLDPEHSDPH